MWETYLASTAAQALGGSGSKASGGGAAATISPTSRADFGSQDFSFGNISLGGSKDKTALWIGIAALTVAAVGLVLIVRA